MEINNIFIYVFVTFWTLVSVNGHGRLMEPPARSSMWRKGFNTPINYNDNSLFCGGLSYNQYGYQHGKCGVCGDPYQGPYRNEAGGIYAKGVIARHYRPGEIINVEPITKDGLNLNYVQIMIYGVDPNGKGCVGCGNQEEFYGCSDISIGTGSGSVMTQPPPTTQRPFIYRPTQGPVIVVRPTQAPVVQPTQAPFVQPTQKPIQTLRCHAINNWAGIPYLEKWCNDRCKTVVSSTHNIVAYRFTDQGTIDGGIDEVGEYGGGRCVLDAMKEDEINNAPVIVSRVFGKKLDVAMVNATDSSSTWTTNNSFSQNDWSTTSNTTVSLSTQITANISDNGNTQYFYIRFCDILDTVAAAVAAPSPPPPIPTRISSSSSSSSSSYNQYGYQHGKCGVCGDPYQGPYRNEAGGIYAKGVIARHYRPGEIINVEVEITANHKGWFEFKLCPNNDVTKKVTQECLDKYLLYLPDDQGTSYGVDPNGKGCVGCGNQEEFYGCSDISIGTGSGSVMTQPPPTTQRPFIYRPTQGPVIVVRPTQAPVVQPTQAPFVQPTQKPIQTLRCHAINNWAGIPYLEKWCNDRCKTGSCPVNACACD
ncbi:hypothetical protein KUTeg_014558 [Tegillarca granosa]|uniref:Chitin-binding type-4 domain-containing protein n=1 Tax=Tegillarca granosa TaxID=220873 RepID=A0ABQ9ERR2_TEGGR|nr:hypothetical protein KUTeg_014558 [Tegillarca granosa]